jgi:hypothetical protein
MQVVFLAFIVAEAGRLAFHHHKFGISSITCQFIHLAFPNLFLL